MTPTPRLPDWKTRLNAVIDDYDGKPFVWGSRDCAHWAADCTRAATGVDVLGTLRGAWHSRFSCKCRLFRRGWRTNKQAAAGLWAAVGARVISPEAAQLGDVGITSCGTMAVKFAPGFIARDITGRFAVVKVDFVWSVGH